MSLLQRQNTDCTAMPAGLLGSWLGQRLVNADRQVVQLLALTLFFIAAEEGLILHRHDVHLTVITCTQHDSAMTNATTNGMSCYPAHHHHLHVSYPDMVHLMSQHPLHQQQHTLQVRPNFAQTSVIWWSSHRYVLSAGSVDDGYRAVRVAFKGIVEELLVAVFIPAAC